MDNCDDRLPPGFDSLLKSCAQPPMHDSFRSALLAQTTRVIRMRKVRRRLALIGALAACYLGGIATVGLWRTAEVHNAPLSNASVESLVTSVARPNDPQLFALTVTGDVLEIQAETAAPEQRSRRYRLAGLQYEKSGDVRSALRCYALSLRGAESSDLNISPTEDTWLLMAVKSDRQKEKSHENWQE